MTLQDAKQKQKELTRQIYQLVSSFETETELTVNEIDLQRVDVGTVENPNATQLTSVAIRTHI